MDVMRIRRMVWISMSNNFPNQNPVAFEVEGTPLSLSLCSLILTMTFITLRPLFNQYRDRDLLLADTARRVVFPY